MIYGGYILQPRIIQESDISTAPPYVREIWNYLLREANSQENKYKGHNIKRGQLFRSYNDIQEGTKWYIGWRKMTYNENHMKKGMRFLRETGRITTTKERGGVLITICKYDYYQDPKNYDKTTKGTEDRTIAEPQVNQPLPYTNKNNKNNKKEQEEEKKISLNLFEKFWELYPKHPDKGKAKTAWDKICTKKHSKVKELPTWDIIKKAVILQKKSERWQKIEFIPHPTTWLNQSRWLDDPKEMKEIEFAESGNKPKFKFYHDVKYRLDEKDGLYKDLGGNPY